jgi:hypothetical protein
MRVYAVPVDAAGERRMRALCIFATHDQRRPDRGANTFVESSDEP